MMRKPMAPRRGQGCATCAFITGDNKNGSGQMNNFKIVVASMGGVAILSLAQFACAADVRGQAGSNALTVTVPSGAMSGMDGSNGFDTVLAGTPTVTVSSGAMSGMDGSNGFDTVLEAQAPTTKNPRDAQYKLALAECAAMVSTQQSACRTSAQSAYDSNKSAPRL
jgi:predicted dinucleotide-utilizing enzyme